MARQLLSLAEVAQILSVAESTVRRLIEERGLPATRPGYARKVDAEDLERWIAAQQVQPGDLRHLA